MLRDGQPSASLRVRRAEPGPFTDNEIELLKTFADQAVIAIENTRLFEAEQARTRELQSRSNTRPRRATCWVSSPLADQHSSRCSRPSARTPQRCVAPMRSHLFASTATHCSSRLTTDQFRARRFLRSVTVHAEMRSTAACVSDGVQIQCADLQAET